MVIWDNQIYTRNVNVSVNPVIIPEFKVYGSSQPVPVVVDTTEIVLSADNPEYIVDVNTPDNVLITDFVVGGMVSLPVLTADKTVIFVIPSDSKTISFNDTVVDAGNTVFCVYTSGVWTINPTIITIPIIPNYSDISVQHKFDDYLPLNSLSAYKTTTTPSLLAFQVNDKILVTSSNDINNIGIYQIIRVMGGGITVLKLIVSGISLNTVRVEGDGVYQNQFDGFDVNTVLFEKSGTELLASLPETTVKTGESVVLASGKQIPVEVVSPSEIQISSDPPTNTNIKLWIQSTPDVLSDVDILRANTPMQQKRPPWDSLERPCLKSPERRLAHQRSRSSRSIRNPHNPVLVSRKLRASSATPSVGRRCRC